MSESLQDTVLPDLVAGGRRARKWVGCCLLVILAWPACSYVVQAYRFIGHPYVIENGEGIVLADVQAVYEGKWPYRDIGDYPFLVANYPPLYHVLCAGGMWLSGPRSYAPGRLLTLLAMLGIVVATAQIVRRDTGCPAMAWAGGICILSVTCITRMGPVCRVDMLAASLSLGGLALTHSQLGRRQWVWPVVLFLGALYTKHSAIAGAAASLTYLCFHDRPKAIKSGALLLGLGFWGLVLLSLATQGLFLRHIVTYTWTRFDAHLVWPYIRNGARRGLLVFLISAVGLCWTTVQLKRRGHTCRGRGLLLAYLVVNALTLVQLGKVGVSYFYMVEFAAAVCLTLPLFLSDVCVLTQGRPSWMMAAATTGVLAVLGHVALASPTFRAQLIGPSSALPARWVAALGQVDGPVLAEDVGHLITAGKPVLVNPFILSQLGAPSRFGNVKATSPDGRACIANSPTPDVAAAHDQVLRDIRAAKFAAIQTSSLLDWRQYGPLSPRRWASARRLTDDRFSPEWQQAVLERYRLADTIGLGGIYVPR